MKSPYSGINGMLRNQTRFERVSIFIFRSGHNPTCNWQKESNDFALHRQIVRDWHLSSCFLKNSHMVCCGLKIDQLLVDRKLPKGIREVW